MSDRHESWVDRLGLDKSFDQLDPASQIDEICDAFEHQWRGGRGQPTEDFLSGSSLSQETLSKAEQELIPLEVEFRIEAGDAPSLPSFISRFPHQALFIARFICKDNLGPSLDPPLKQLDNYWLLEKVGSGNFGVVFRAYDGDLDRFVAIKRPTAGLGDEESIHRFEREARNAGRLSHPGIVPIHHVRREKGVDGEPGPPYIVSDFVDGDTLDTLLSHKGKLSPRGSASLVAQVAEAVHYAHGQNIIHRDLKPANIILESRKVGDSTQDGTADDSLRPKVLDFGLARRQDSTTSLSLHGSVVGTPAYMSPEQAEGDPDKIDHRVDVYSLGTILYECVFGQRCFPGESVAGVLIDVVRTDPPLLKDRTTVVHRDLITICEKCLNKDRADRYDTTLELAEDLRRWLNGEEIRARPLPLREKAVRWLRRHVAVVLAMLAGVGLLIFALWSMVARERDTIQTHIVAIENATPGSLPSEIDRLLPELEQNALLRRFLVRRSEAPTLPAPLRLRWDVILGKPMELDFFLEAIDSIPISEVSTLARYTKSKNFQSRPQLADHCSAKCENGENAIKALIFLAQLYPAWTGWSQYGQGIVSEVARAGPDQAAIARGLQPVASQLLEECKDYFSRTKSGSPGIGQFASILFEQDQSSLIWFLEQARGDEIAHFAPWRLRSLQTDTALTELSQRLEPQLSLPPWHLAPAHLRPEVLVERRVNLALFLAACTAPASEQHLQTLLASDEDPRPRTYFIRRAKFFLSPETLAKRIRYQPKMNRRENHVLFCTILAASLFDRNNLDNVEKTIADNLLEIYRKHPDSGVHSAAAFTLKRLGYEGELKELKSHRDLQEIRDDRQWFHLSSGICMIIIEPGEYQLGPGEYKVSAPGMAITISRRFALAATEMTNGEYRLVTGEGDIPNNDKPMLFNDLRSLDQLAASDRADRRSMIDTCRAVNAQEGTADVDCFDTEEEDIVVDCRIDYPAFRLPTSREWLVACAAASRTRRYCGTKETDVVAFIPTDTEASYSVMDFMPNRLGFCGLYGNAADLCLTPYRYDDLNLVPALLENSSDSADRALLADNKRGADRVVLRSDDLATIRGGDINSKRWQLFTTTSAPLLLMNQHRSVKIRKWLGLRLTRTLP